MDKEKKIERFKPLPIISHIGTITFFACFTSFALLRLITRLININPEEFNPFNWIVGFSSIIFVCFFVTGLFIIFQLRYEYKQFKRRFSEGLHSNTEKCTRKLELSNLLKYDSAEDLWNAYNIFNFKYICSLERDSAYHGNTIWILTSDLSLESSDSEIYRIMMENIDKEVNYVYFIPEKIYVKSTQQLDKSFGANKTIKIKLKEDPEKGYELLFKRFDVIIYNPNGKNSQAYVCIHFEQGRERYRKLPDNELSSLMETLTEIRQEK